MARHAPLFGQVLKNGFAPTRYAGCGAVGQPKRMFETQTQNDGACIGYQETDSRGERLILADAEAAAGGADALQHSGQWISSFDSVDLEVWR